MIARRPRRAAVWMGLAAEVLAVSLTPPAAGQSEFAVPPPAERGTPAGEREPPTGDEADRQPGDAGERQPGDAGERQPSRDLPPAFSPPPPPRLDQLPPPARLGVRAEERRRAMIVHPTLVIVPDSPSFVEAIAAWNAGLRYPVLIDDGSVLTRENIARFARSFEPERIVLWARGGEEPWPEAPGPRRRLLERASADAWDAGPDQTLLDRLAQMGFDPPGIIAAWPTDPAWPAALALSAGRGQPIAWHQLRGPISGALAPEAAAELHAALAAALDATGLAWRDLGDTVDAVTICARAPIKVQMDPAERGSFVALTDLVGRTPGEEHRRWAWAGQIVGSEADSAYIAMASLFIQPRRAWLFDGYPDEAPWNQWDASSATGKLIQRGFDVVLDDTPAQGAAEFRARASGAWVRSPRVAPPPEAPGSGVEPGAGLPDPALPPPPPGGLDADLIFINTKGNREWFDLTPGRCYSGDLPVLSAPAVLHFVHSFSLSRLGDDDSIGSRWLSRGVFAYAGSVAEPNLQAFLPTAGAAGAWTGTNALGAAARAELGRPWRVAFLGDPLLTLGPRAPRMAAEPPVPLDNLTTIDDALESALRGGAFDDAIFLLTVQGRDADALRLLRGVVRDRPESLGPRGAALALGAAFRLADAEAVTLAGERALGAMNEAPWIADLLWQALAPKGASLSERQVDLLLGCLRSASAPRDAQEVAPALARWRGQAAADALLQSVAPAQQPQQPRRPGRAR